MDLPSGFTQSAMSTVRPPAAAAPASDRGAAPPRGATILDPELASFLEKLSLSRYADVFAAQDLTMDDVEELTDADFLQMGVSIGHRKQLLRALKGDRDIRSSANSSQRESLSASNASNGDSSQLDPTVWIQFGELRLDKEPLASGSFGSVFRAAHPRSGSVYAAKVLKVSEEELDEEAREDFRHEAAMLLHLRHPQVISCVGLSRTAENNLVLLSEFMGGGGLNRWIYKLSYKFPEDIKLRLAAEIAAGLAYLHSRSVIHRDLKSDNVLLDEDGRHAKVGDLGLAKAHNGMSYVHTAAGTVMYMAPEMLREEKYGPAVDVYSFALVLFELWASRRPYTSRQAANLQAMRVTVVSKNERPDFKDIEMSEELQSYLQRCWESNPKQRPAMAEVAELLRTRAESSAKAEPLGSPRPSPTAVPMKINSSPRPRAPELNSAPSVPPAVASQIAKPAVKMRTLATAGTNPFEVRTDDWHRFNTVRELVANEKSYIEDLEALVAVYLQPLRTSRLIEGGDFNSIFSNVEALLSMHKQLILELERSPYAEEVMVGAVFAKFVESFQIYKTYCGTRPTARQQYDSLIKNKSKFAAFIDQASQDTRCRGQKLPYFLLLPLDHVCKYPLLLPEIRKHTKQGHPDHEMLVLVVERMTQVVLSIQESVSRAEAQQRVAELQTTIEDIGELATPGRALLKEGALQLRPDSLKEKPSDRTVFLFNDLLVVVSKSKSFTKKSIQWQMKSWIPLADCKMISNLPLENTFGLEVKMGQKTAIYLFTAPDQGTCKDWLDRLKAQMHEGGKVGLI